MKYDEFMQAHRDAELFMQENDTLGVSFNAILTMCYFTRVAGAVQNSASAVQCSAPGITTPTATAIPEWFTAVLPKFEGRKLTASTLLSEIGRPTGIGELRLVGGWLRQLVGEPKRSNGQTIFHIILTEQMPKNHNNDGRSDDDEPNENPFDSAIPIGARVLNFIAMNEGEFTVMAIAKAIDVADTPAESKIIWEALGKHGIERKGNKFIIKRKT